MLKRLWNRLTGRQAADDAKAAETLQELRQSQTEIGACQKLRASAWRQRSLRLQLDLQDIERRLAKSDTIRQTLLRFLTDGPDSVPAELLKTLPREAFEYVTLRCVEAGYQNSIAGFTTAANNIESRRLHVC